MTSSISVATTLLSKFKLKKINICLYITEFSTCIFAKHSLILPIYCN